MLQKSPSYNLRNLISGTEKIISSPFSILKENKSKVLFCNYLSATAHIIKASTDIMAVARDSLMCENSNNKQQLFEYLNEHIEEESGHYEWVVEDLGAVTDDVPGNMLRTQTSSVIAVPGCAYYSIRNESPWAVLGYIAVMEGSPPSDATLDDVAKACDVPSSALRTLKIHGDLDVGHIDELYDFIDSCVFSEYEYLAINRMAIMTINSYAAAMHSVLFEK